MEMQKYDHLSVAGLKERIFNIVVQNVDLVSSDGGVTETVCVSFQTTGHSFANNVRPDVQILQFRVAFILREDESILFHQVFFLSFLGLSVFKLFLNLFYQSEGCVKIGRGRGYFSGLFCVCTSICSGNKNKKNNILRSKQKRIANNFLNLKSLKHALHLHFFNKCCIWLGISSTLVSAHSSSRMEKIYSEVSVISFDRLRYIFDC